MVSCAEAVDLSGIESTLADHEARLSKLEKICSDINTEMASLRGILESLDDHDCLVSVTEFSENGRSGYTLTFSKGGSYKVYNGIDGTDGADGKDGVNGTNGKDGADGYVPAIGVKQEEDGCWYWTVDGKLLTDGSGNPVKAVATDGKDGANGADGKDGANGADGKDAVTPQLKIVDGYWYVSYDNGATWSTEPLGKAVGEDGANGTGGDSIFSRLAQDDDNVYLTLASDGSVITLPKKARLQVVLDVEELRYDFDEVYSFTFGYSILNASGEVNVIISSPHSLTTLEKTSATEGTVKVYDYDESGEDYVSVIAVDANGNVAVKSFHYKCNDFIYVETFSDGICHIGYKESYNRIDMATTYNCRIEISDDASSWLSLAPETKTVKYDDIRIHVTTNTSLEERSGVVSIYDIESGAILGEVTVAQDPCCDEEDIFRFDPGTYNVSYVTYLGEEDETCDKTLEVLPDGRCVLKSFFGAEGYDLEFYLTSNGIVVLNGQLYPYRYYSDYDIDYRYSVETGVEEPKYAALSSSSASANDYVAKVYLRWSDLYDRYDNFTIFLSDEAFSIEEVSLQNDPKYSYGTVSYEYSVKINVPEGYDGYYGVYYRRATDGLESNNSRYFDANEGTITLDLTIDDYDLVDYENLHAESEWIVGAFMSLGGKVFFNPETIKLCYDRKPAFYDMQEVTNVRYDYTGYYAVAYYTGVEYADGWLFMDHIDTRYEDNWSNEGSSKTIMSDSNGMEDLGEQTWSSSIRSATEENFNTPLVNGYFAVLRNGETYEFPTKVTYLSGSFTTTY